MTRLLNACNARIYSAMARADLFLKIERLFPDGIPVNRNRIETLSGLRGAYLLVLNLSSPVQFSRKNIAGASLSGWYIYAGSARGSGGIGARLQRHFRKDKPVHWHVDELTNRADKLDALAIPNGSEGEIVESLVGSMLFEPALRGFGSSDCTHCEAHLLRPVHLALA